MRFALQLVCVRYLGTFLNDPLDVPTVASSVATPRPGQVPQRLGLGGQAVPGRYLDRLSGALPVTTESS